MGCHFLLQGIFLTQGSNLGLPHCRQTLCHLSRQGGPFTSHFSFTFDLCLRPQIDPFSNPRPRLSTFLVGASVVVAVGVLCLLGLLREQTGKVDVCTATHCTHLRFRICLSLLKTVSFP